jgi:1-acyl-sn-glycerol-3-phosphate acyltransferase
MNNILMFPFLFFYRIYAFGLFIMMMLLVFIIMMPLLLMGHIKGGNAIFKVIRVWAKAWFLLIGIRCKVSGLEHIKKGEHYLFIGNHGSYFDIPIIFHSIVKPVRVLGKAELAKIPIFGIIYRSLAVLVDRSSKQGRAQSVRTLKYYILKDTPIIIFPEGTFNTGNTPLKEFYDGAFRIALQTETPLLPFVIHGVQEVLHREHWYQLYPGKVELEFLQPLPIQKYSMATLNQFKLDAYTEMENALLKGNRWHY